LNRRRKDFQSFALPTELSRHFRIGENYNKAIKRNQSNQARTQRRSDAERQSVWSVHSRLFVRIFFTEKKEGLRIAPKP